MASNLSYPEFAFDSNNSVSLIKGGQPYFSQLIQCIENAVSIIHLQVYIFAEDETGKLVAAALKNAVQRNVQVYLLVDGYASQSLSASFIRELKEAGIRFRFFEPVFRSTHFYFGRRMHHKVVVVDDRYALVGGINIADRYNDIQGIPAWLDFALFLEGDLAKELSLLCWKTWNGFMLAGKKIPINNSPVLLPASFNRMPVRMRRNDWVRRKNQISRTYLEMFRTAKKEVIICSSYFLPGRVLRRNILMAVARGVQVKLLLAGLSDVKVAKHAERFMYDWLLRNKVQIYEYEEKVLHAKIAVCDGEWMTAGSYNINNISAYASIELNLDVRDAAFALSVKDQLESIIDEQCEEVTLEKHQRTYNWFTQFRRWISYNLVRGLIRLFTFYFRQEQLPLKKKKGIIRP